ncbi:MAG TPA: HAMP domain-containing sensor histidine kinase [Puia sp.]|uniref:sensor histidine kinase n=1 Tax=Puia sp. TaxID=2045100 RepID=UPI002C8E375F|nr:HAMP domain-containing sensor histidine kinase [Puia sp.]HVU94835.1 HAMP domain-containing sensor histidine kinase [Puia sp.]
MEQRVMTWMGKWVKPGYRSSGGLSAEYDVSNQVNLIAAVVIAFLGVGFLAHFIQHFSESSIFLTVACIPVLCFVMILNKSKRFEFANVLFYIVLNVICAIVSREMSTPMTTTVLGFVLSLCLIVFLFQIASTRIICGFIVVFRMLLLELNAGLLNGTIATSSRYVVDGMELSLVVLVLTMYALQIKSIENAQIQNEILLQHMTHDMQAGFRALSTIIERVKRFSDNHGDKGIRKDQIDELVNGSRYYGYMLNNFLEFARKENTSITNNRLEEMDLVYELDAIIEIHKYMADEKQIRIQLDVDDGLPTLIVSDRVKIRRIVLNLLDNAIKNSPSGKTIQITVGWNGSSWQLTVANEGKGLDADEIHQLFVPYSTSGEHSASKRLGLGLPITKLLAEALGGNITATSEINKETHFTVAFPVNANAS